jgi:hypothetical protein
MGVVEKRGVCQKCGFAALSVIGCRECGLRPGVTGN